VRQTDPNWEAFFFLTDEKPFEKRLTEILAGFNDTRLNFFDVPLDYRPVVSKLFFLGLAGFCFYFCTFIVLID
jgi:hypothetical protein